MNVNSIKETEQKKTKTLNERPYYSTFLVTAGVILPLIALFVELGTRMCAKDLFDPIPSWWHVLFVAFVPITNLQVWYAVMRGKIERLSWLGFANAAAIFISLFYTIIFLPIVPMALIGILLLIGVLPLAPIFSLLAGILLRRQLRNVAPSEKPFNLQWKGLFIAGFVVFCAFGLAELTFTLTRMGIRQANSQSSYERDDGIRFLRNYGDKHYLLRLCYGDSEINVTDIVVKNVIGNIEGDNLTSKEDARRAYYLLTGKSYWSAPVPREIKNWQRFDNGFQRGEDGMVLIDGLKLADSQMDGSVDGDAALGYLEWTLVFKNETSRQQEAISQIQLPPDAVVSRLTLWIDGEEREAAFAKRAKVTEAYEKVTATKRDPALLTVSGKDRVSLKCFPVPPNGEMKVRIGITMPLILENENSSLMLMPYFQEKNFGISTEHSVWIESKKQLEIADPNFENKQEDNFFTVRGNVKDDELLSLGSPVRIGKTELSKISWAKDTNGSETIVKQEIVENTSPKAENLIFVVDTSASMKEFQNGIAETIKNLPADIETTLVFTNGSGYNISSAAPSIMGQSPADIAWYISEATFAGGTDSVLAIETAYKLADAKPNSAIIRLYAPQTVELSSPETLMQFRRRRPDVSPIYLLQTKRGKDVIDAQLISSNAVQTVPRFGTFNDDLKKFLAELTGQTKTFKAVRTIEKAEDFTAPANSKETSQHLVRLWASSETEKLAENGKDDEAIELAVKNGLVTSVSGAVVLETQQQYDQFGLKPVELNTVPTIPEPEEYLLFAVVLLVLFWFFRKFRNQNLQTA